MATIDGLDDAAGKIDMVVLQQNHVEEADAMVHAAADLDGLLLQDAEARRRLARVEDVGSRALQALHVAARHRGDAAHALHDVEHQTLRLQQRAHLARDDEGHVARLDMGAVMDEDLHLERRVEAVEHLAGNLHAREHALLLDEELALAHRLLGDAAKGGVVAVANILGKGQIDQSLFQFFYTQHILFFF